jgi:polar amino acid transport system substrate-binding protein
MIKNSPCYVGLNKGEPKLKERINQIVEKAKKDGTLNAIAKKWLKLNRPVSSLL